MVYLIYADDHDEWLPLTGQFANYPMWTERHTVYNGPYVAYLLYSPLETAFRNGYVGDWGASRCPSNEWKMATNGNGDYGDIGENYSINPLIFGQPRLDYATGVLQANDDQATSLHPPKQATKDASPATLLLSADGVTGYDYASCCVTSADKRVQLYWGRGAAAGARGVSPTAWDNPPATDLNAYGYRHDGPNGFFADGHGEKGQARADWTATTETDKWPFPFASYRARDASAWYAYLAP